MELMILFGILDIYIIIRTVAYGIYSIKETGLAGGISVLALAAAAVVSGYIVIFCGKGIG